MTGDRLLRDIGAHGAERTIDVTTRICRATSGGPTDVLDADGPPLLHVTCKAG